MNHGKVLVDKQKRDHQLLNYNSQEALITKLTTLEHKTLKNLHLVSSDS